ncbi:MAG TPA: copper amine oxidase N-terminal domain-containing protein, partial [Bacilli bacterium]|nr:copper amine oxidase N-terminal domain-containing protein [Bacilli bacterium]
NLLWNGTPKKLEGEMLLEHNTVYVEATQLADLYKDALKDWRFRIGEWGMRVNGRHVELPSPVLMKGGGVYLPLRAVSETLGAQVYWVEESQTISVLMRS